MAICTDPIEDTVSESTDNLKKEKYEKYKYKDYKPAPHEYVEKTTD